ncbi:MAG: threonine-phosphate decarboxylase CobD [Desulfobacteraceae bacterium]|nr:threonine-phosphate decarboxylase CobD [Desulfobacteraceae bacterium]
MTIIHGGNVYELAARSGCSPDDILDYSASINPLGPPPGLNDLLASHFHRLQHYPDIRNSSLINALAEFHGISPESLAVGNGSTELIYWLPKALGTRKVLALMPTFGEYAKAFELQGCEVRKLRCGPAHNYLPTRAQLEEAFLEHRPDTILLTHPGSPSGSLLDTQVREWVAERSASGDVHIIVDEVFADFCEHASFKDLLGRARNLVLIRSLTKFYGLPGLRIGYVMASPQTAERIRQSLPPWSVNTLAQAAGAYCLKQEDYRRRTLDLVTAERKNMIRELSAIKGLSPFAGEANYVLVEMERSLSPAGRLRVDVFDRERILIRDCGSFEGLDEYHFRVAVRLPEQNRRLIDALRQWTRYCA